MLTEPSTDHIDLKIISWLLSLVLIGLLAGTMLVNYENKVWRVRAGRSVRSSRVMSKRKVAYN